MGERTLRTHRQFWASLRSPAAVNILSEQVVSVLDGTRHEGADSLDPELQHGSSDLHSHDTDNTVTHDRNHTGGRRKKHRKPKPVTGVSIATRNAATSNWKGDVKKLLRKQSELTDMITKIEILKPLVARRKVSAKDRALLEEEDDIKWQLEEISAELEE